AGGCPPTCPDGSPLPEELPPLEAASVLALSAGTEATTATLVGTSLDSFCAKPSPPPGPQAIRLFLDKAGLRIDAVSCTGAFGAWSGILRWGSIPGTDTGYLPYRPKPYVDIPITWTVTGTTGHAKVTGSFTTGSVVPGKAGRHGIVFDLTFQLNAAGTAMTVTGSDTGDIDGASLGTEQLSYPDNALEPAPAGRCP
ncbi:MAG: hypothetical protein QOI92_1549, partial [Chloroflexota bacterium]|nr:hypothetical protein [Chloroflexota bacterium]